MSTYNEEVGKKLNDLLERTYDAEKGFKKAAENVEHQGLKNYFNNKAQQRYEFGHELKNEIKSFGQNVEKGGSLKGSAHRAWMDVKSMFSADNEEKMLEESLRGERAALDEYNDIMEDVSIPASTKNVLSNQKNKIQAGLSTINRLEDLR